MTNPLTPPGCDLRDFPFLPIDVQRLLTSETWVLGTADEKAAAITLWLACWHQVPAASVPNNDRMLAHLSQAGSKWPKVKEHALRGWVDGGDGRLYHPVVAEKALAAWIEKLNSAISGAVGNAKRWQTEVDTSAQEAALCDAICRLKRIAPASPCLKKKVVMSRNKSSPPDRPPTQNSSPPDRKREGEREGEGYREIPPTSSHQCTPRAPRGDDEKPQTPAEWVEVFAEQHGVDVDHRNFHDRKKFWPLAAAWTNAGVTVGQMRAACAKAFSSATEPIAWLPAYADRVLAGMQVPPPNPRREAKSFAQQDREAGWARWEEMTGRVHPDRVAAEGALIIETEARYVPAIEGR